MYIKLKSKMLTNKKGASLIFVMCISLLFMTIGISALVAGSSNAAFVQYQREYNQVRLLEDSIHRIVMYSLQRRDVPFDSNHMSFQLMNAIYDSHLERWHEWNVQDFDPNARESLTNRFDRIELVFDMEDPEVEDMAEVSIFLTIPVDDIDFNVKLSGVDENYNNIAGIRKTAEISAQLFVDVEIRLLRQTDVNRIVRSRSIYVYSGGVLTAQNAANPDTMIIQWPRSGNDPRDEGQWTMMRREVGREDTP
jgi:hypothetical protein